jgi:hypothetical protein
MINFLDYQLCYWWWFGGAIDPNFVSSTFEVDYVEYIISNLK